MSTLFEDTPTNPSVVPPAEPAGDDAESTLRVKVYMEMLKRHLNEKEVLTNNLHSFFTVLWGQCSPGIQCKLRGKIEFLIKKEDGDYAWLLEEIRQVMYNFSSGRYRLRTLFDAKLDLLKFRQGRLPTFRYFEKYLQQINAFERGGGSIGIDKGIVSYVETWHEDVLDAHPGPPPLQPDAPQIFDGERLDVYTTAEVDAIRDPLEAYIHAMDAYDRACKKWERKKEIHQETKLRVARDMYVGFLIVNNASEDKYGELQYDLNQSYLTGTNNFPTSADDALRLLSNYVPKKKGNINRSRPTPSHSTPDAVSSSTTRSSGGFQRRG